MNTSLRCQADVTHQTVNTNRQKDFENNPVFLLLLFAFFDFLVDVDMEISTADDFGLLAKASLKLCQTW